MKGLGSGRKTKKKSAATPRIRYSPPVLVVLTSSSYLLLHPSTTYSHDRLSMLMSYGISTSRRKRVLPRWR